MTLISSPATLAVYPFAFRLDNHYALRENTLQITHTVTNLDSKTLPFSLGAHPAFNCPLLPDENFTDYQIAFPQSENLTRLKMNPDSTFAPQRLHFGQNVTTIPLTRELFADDALVFENLASRTVSLLGPKHSIALNFEHAPWFGIWTKGDFICLEPWQGHGDFPHPPLNFTDREGTIMLDSQQIHHFSYQITLT